MKKLYMFLQMFAGEEAAAAPEAADVGAAAENPVAAGGDFAVGQKMPDGTQVANAKVAAALNRQMRRHPEMRQVYAQGQQQVQRPVPQGQVEQPGQPTEQPATDGRRPWAEIKELYKEEYGQDVAARVQDRFKNQKDLQAQLDQQTPIVQFAMKQAGVDSVEELAKMIADDDSLLEDEANERGMTVESLKAVKALEAENAQFKAQQEQAKNQAHIQSLVAQCEELKKVYPDIDFFTEMNNPQFRLWTSPAVGMSFEDAYHAIHHKELQTQAVAYGMNRTKQQLGQTIAAQQARPGEGAMNGRSQAAAAEPRINPANMTRAERKKIKDYIRAHPGERVSFD